MNSYKDYADKLNILGLM